MSPLVGTPVPEVTRTWTSPETATFSPVHWSKNVNDEGTHVFVDSAAWPLLTTMTESSAAHTNARASLPDIGISLLEVTLAASWPRCPDAKAGRSRRAQVHACEHTFLTAQPHAQTGNLKAARDSWATSRSRRRAISTPTGTSTNSHIRWRRWSQMRPNESCLTQN